MLIYDNSIKFSFAEKGHKYTIQKKVGESWTVPEPVVGTTTITGIIHKEGLVPWASKLAAYFMRDNVKGTTSIVALAEEAKGQHQVASQRGKDAGTAGHALVEAILKGEKVTVPDNPQIKSVAIAFNSWMTDFNPKVVGVEVPIYSRLHGFAGKFDLLCEINGKLTVVDFKTSNASYYNPDGIYAENYAQMGAYSIGIEEMEGKEVEEMMIVNLSKEDEKYRLKTLSDLGLTKVDAQLYFLNCLGLYRLHQTFNNKLKG